MTRNPIKTSSLDYEMLKRNKREQRAAKDALITEKILIEQAQEESGSASFGKMVKPGIFARITGFVWRMVPQIFGLVTLVAIFVGFRLREFEYFTAEEGVGYALGIIGASMMLALLLYPLRKRFRLLRFIGDVRAWFGIHMVFGVLGPLLILYHANFSLGSTNSNVALFSMLIVSASGIVGRYIYTKIHHGLYGKKIGLSQLKAKLDSNQQEMSALLHLSPAVKADLFGFVDHVLSPTRGLLHSWARILSVGIRSRFMVRKIKKSVRRELKRNAEMAGCSRKELRARVNLIVQESDHFLKRLRKVVEFDFYERMFALWHVLHLPLFFMLVIAAIVHIIAVHWY